MTRWPSHRRSQVWLALLLSSTLLSAACDESLVRAGADAAPGLDGAGARDTGSAPGHELGAPVADAASPPPPSDPPEVRPFDPDHPVYHPIPPGCPLYEHSAKIVANMAANHKEFSMDTGGDSPGIYVGSPSDPVYQLSIAGKTFQVHTPVDAQAGSGSDAPLIVLDKASPDYGGIPVEYRMWQANVNHGQKRITCSNGGVGCYANAGGPCYDGQLATGHAEIHGQNTGSGESYSVGMIRPVDVKRGHIDHAIRVAIAYPHNTRWFWPANRTEPDQPYSGGGDSRAPMGARIFLDASVDINAVADAVAARLPDAKNKAFARIFVKALQEYGMIALDGTDSGHNVYFEGGATANWESLIGPKNAYGSYNDISRALVAELPWDKFRVAAESVFDSYAH